MLVVATPIIWVLTRRLTRNARERERLLRASMTASEAERRRIARDLHDGVVQDLAGTAFSLTAVSRDPQVPDRGARATCSGAGQSLRTSLKALRSLLVSIHPPDLHADGLAAALTDLTAPAAAAHIESTVRVSDVGQVPDDDGGAGVAGGPGGGAQRHPARARRHSLDVEVHRHGRSPRAGGDRRRRRLRPARPTGTPDSFGLRGLASLVQDEGGRLDVRSAPGEGTEVRMEVRVR